MLVTNHVLSGAVIGAASRRRPAAAFAVGAVMGAMTALAPRDSRLAVLAGMAGAALPDLDKPSVVFFGRSPWPALVNRFHLEIQQHEADRHLKYEVAAAAVFTAAAVGLLRRRRKRVPVRRRFAVSKTAGS